MDVFETAAMAKGILRPFGDLWEVWEETMFHGPGGEWIYGEPGADLMNTPEYLEAIVAEERALRSGTARPDDPKLMAQMDVLVAHDPDMEILRLSCLADPFWRTAPLHYGNLPVEASPSYGHAHRMRLYLVLGRLRPLVANAILGSHPQLLDQWRELPDGSKKSLLPGCLRRVIEKFEYLQANGPDTDDPELIGQLSLANDDPGISEDRSARLAEYPWKYWQGIKTQDDHEILEELLRARQVCLADPWAYSGYGIKTIQDLENLVSRFMASQRERDHKRNPFSKEALEWQSARRRWDGNDN